MTLTKQNAHIAVYLERRDPARNLARFYALDVEADLFGEILAVRRWGRIGSVGQRLSIPCGSREDALAEIEHMARRKRHRGYRDR